MKTAKTLLLTLIFILSCTSTQAQFWKKLQKKAEEKIEREAERRAERRVNKKIDKTFDNAEKGLDKVGTKKSKTKSKKNTKEKSEQEINTEQQQANNMFSDMLGGMMSGKEVKTKGSYTFNVTATMQVTDHIKKNGETMQMKQSYGKSAIMSEIENPKNIVINDFESEAAIMINPLDKTAQVMSLSFLKKMTKQEPIAENNTAKMTKTGATKTLNGYTCHQYIITDEDIKIDAWFAPKVNFDYQDYLSGMNKMFGNKKSNAASLLNQGKGYVMEMTMYNKGKKQSEMKVTALSEIPITINMSDYTIQKMF